MKTQIKKIKNAGALVLLLLIMSCSLLLMLQGCSKDSSDEPSKAPYKNLKDDSTTSIKLSIPRMEVSPLKSTEVLLYLSITDQNGHPFTDFNQYNFVVQQVCAGYYDTSTVATINFSKLNQSGNSIAVPLVLDFSGSMDGYIPDLDTAVMTFINIKEANDQYALIKFSTDIELVQPFTKDKNTLLTKLWEYWSPSYNTTAFYDALGLGLTTTNTFLTSNPNYFPAVIGFTDGLDNASYSEGYSSIISRANTYQIPVYALGFGDADSLTLNSLAESTGGRYYYAPESSQLQYLYSLISGQIKNVYVLKWSYTNTNCYDVNVVVKASYTCANGTYTSKAIKSFVPFKKK